MKKKTCAVFLFDDYADWEPALALAILRKYGNYTVVSFSQNGESVVSTGGLVNAVQGSLESLNIDDIDLLLLPGGEAWEQGGNLEVLSFVRKAADSNKHIAAICGATIALGRAGLLNDVPHTSNSLDYLKSFCPEYRGEEYYRHTPCCSSAAITTANGAAMIELAYELALTAEILDKQTAGWVLELYKSGGMVNKFAEQ